MGSREGEGDTMWRNVFRQPEVDRGVVAGPPKFVIVAVAAGMITGALMAPSSEPAPDARSSLAEHGAAVSPGVVDRSVADSQD
jgi:hypothetical protein